MQTVIATTTFYKDTDDIRFKLACQTIKKAQKSEYPIVIVDGSLNPSIAKKFSELSAIVFPETIKGMGPSRRLSFFYALHHLLFTMSRGDGIILWIEPEKDDVVRLIPEIIFQIECKQADISIMKRSEKSWQTYPRFQQDSEKKANAAYEKATGRIGHDPMSGPVAFLASVLQKYLFFNPSQYGIADTYIQHYIPLFVPVDLVASVEVDFMYPPAQKAAEETADNEEIRKKRNWQLSSLSKDYHILAKTLKIGPYA